MAADRRLAALNWRVSIRAACGGGGRAALLLIRIDLFCRPAPSAAAADRGGGGFWATLGLWGSTRARPCRRPPSPTRHPGNAAAPWPGRSARLAGDSCHQEAPLRSAPVSEERLGPLQGDFSGGGVGSVLWPCAPR